MLRQTVVLTENAYLSWVAFHLFISADGLFLDWGHCVRELPPADLGLCADIVSDGDFDVFSRSGR